MTLLNRLGNLALDLLTLALAGMAVIGWSSVIAGTAAVNGDGGAAVLFTWLAVFMAILSRIER